MVSCRESRDETKCFAEFVKANLMVLGITRTITKFQGFGDFQDNAVKAVHSLSEHVKVSDEGTCLRSLFQSNGRSEPEVSKRSSPTTSTGATSTEAELNVRV